MADPVIDASPLILFSRAGYLELLRVAGERVRVPQAVAAEIRVYGEDDPTAIAVAQTEWLDVVSTPDVPAEIEAYQLGPGEAAALTLAWFNPGTEVIIDDLDARRCAASLGIPVRGTLGIVLAARQHDIIAAVRPVVARLLAAGLYLSDRVLNEALRRVGE